MIRKGQNRGLILDLDDTLYSRDQFVRSGLTAVARFVAQGSGVPAQNAFRTMYGVVAGGRPRLAFQTLCHVYGLSETGISTMLEIYRSHRAALSLAPGVKDTLADLRRTGWRLVVLTNGLPSVQAGKVEALNLETLVDGVVYAEEVAPEGKPAAAAFKAALRRLRLGSDRCVCVGDDPFRDIAGARALGILTIRVDTDNCESQPDREADAVVEQFSDVPPVAAALLDEVTADVA